LFYIGWQGIIHFNSFIEREKERSCRDKKSISFSVISRYWQILIKEDVGAKKSEHNSDDNRKGIVGEKR